MPVLNCGVGYDGRPTIELYVTMGKTEAKSRRSEGLKVPGSVPVLALVDTGAGQSQVGLSVLNKLGVPPLGEVDVFTASTGTTAEIMEEFEVDLSLAGDRPGPLAEDLKVIGSAKLAGLAVDMLLGRDILDNCLLAYDGPNRRFSLAYDPPTKPTDIED